MDLLNGQPVSVLSGNEFMPIEGKSFKQQVDEYFESQGRVAHSPFGDVILDMKGIKNDISHGIGRLKSSSFAAVKDVLERGVVINPMAQYHTNGKKNPTGMIAAPIQIGDEKYVCVVEVIANTQIQRLYVHEVTLTKNLQRVVADTTAVHGDVAPVTQPKGEIAKVLQNYLINKQKEDNTENNQNIKTESRNMSRKNKITRNTFVDTDYGDVRYVLLSNGTTLRIFLPTFEEIDSLARALYHQVGDVYKFATRRDMPTDLGYWLDVSFVDDDDY